MSKSRQLHPLFTQKHKDYMKRALSATISVAEGAVRAGKTVDNVAAFARMLDLGVRDRIHLATGSTSANAKLNIGDCNGFGLEHIFRGRCHWTKYKGNDALAIKAKNKRTYIVIFAGGGKADSYKKIRGNSYGMWIATEINLHHPDTIKEAMNRQLAAVTRRIFWDLNPGSPAHWIYKDFIDRFPEAYGADYNYEHFTIRDNASISEKRFREIEAQYDKGSIWYKRDILGIRCNAEGVIYDMFNTDTHVVHSIDSTYGDMVVSADYGIQNATTFLFWRKTKEGKWREVHEYYYSGREQHRQKTVSELVDGMEEAYMYLKASLSEDVPIKKVIIDPSATALKVELRKRGYKVSDADNDVLPGINDVSSALYGQMIEIYEGCKNTIEEFGIYMWDPKAAENGEDKPIKENDHCQDAIRYFVRTMKLIKKKERKYDHRSIYEG